MNSVRVCGWIAWVVSFDTHNDLRLAVDALSGGRSATIYAGNQRGVRQDRRRLSCRGHTVHPAYHQHDESAKARLIAQQTTDSSCFVRHLTSTAFPLIPGAKN